MIAKGVSHIAVCVRDLKKSLEFYRDFLGMKVTLQTTQQMARRPGSQSTDMYRSNHQSRTVANIALEDAPDAAPFLVLTSHPGDDVSGEPIKLDQIGIHHISFTVDNVQAVADGLASHGVPLAGNMQDYTNDHGVVRTIFVYDPDGILVQFDERPRG